MKKVSKKDLKNADRFIALIRAFKKGASIQKKSRYSDWTDIDLGDYMDKSAVCYRIKRK